MRPARMGAIGGGGAILAIVFVLVARALGVDITGGGGGGGGGGLPGGPEPGSPSAVSGERGIPAERDPDRELFEFVSFVVDDVQDSFAKQFREQGKQYQPAKLVVFTDAVDSGCGIAGSQIGPFYCPADRQAYVDLSFYRVLRDRLGAGGDFAQAYVIAHEIGHHVQNLTGINERFRGRDNQTSIRIELQADCLAGVWAHSTQQRRLLEAGDIEESMNAAAQIGDDRLQRRGGGRVNPETWTHGSSAQRMKWFERGLRSGDMRACDTYSGEI